MPPNDVLDLLAPSLGDQLAVSSIDFHFDEDGQGLLSVNLDHHFAGRDHHVSTIMDSPVQYLRGIGQPVHGLVHVDLLPSVPHLLVDPMLLIGIEGQLQSVYIL